MSYNAMRQTHAMLLCFKEVEISQVFDICLWNNLRSYCTFKNNFFFRLNCKILLTVLRLSQIVYYFFFFFLNAVSIQTK